jgi:hypothetical protein
MDMAERPIVEAGAIEVGDRAGRIAIVARGAGEAGMQQRDIGEPLDRRLELRQQAFGRMGLGKADSVDCDAARFKQDGLGPAAKQLDAVGKRQIFDRAS